MVDASQETQEILDGASPQQHQRANGLPSAEDRSDGTLGNGDLPPSSKQFAGEGEPAAAAATLTAPETVAAVPPAFLGTFIIEAISVMLLKDCGDVTITGGESLTGDSPGGSLAAGRDAPRVQPAATGASASAGAGAGAGAALGTNTAVPRTHRLRPALSPGRPERRRRGGGASTGLPAPRRRRYSGTVYLDIAGIGAGIDLPLPGRTSPLPAASAVASPTAAAVEMEEKRVGESEGGGQQPQRGHQRRQQYLAEFAIKGITVTDISAERRRRGSLSRLVSGGASGAPPAGSSAAPGTGGASASGVGGTRECQRNDDDDDDDDDDGGGGGGGGDDVRVLSGGWWHHCTGDENSGELDAGYDELVLLTARFCPESGTAAIDASLASSRLMLLPAPVLDALDVVAGVGRGIAEFSRRRADAESDPGGSRQARLSADRRDGRLSTAASSSAQVEDDGLTPSGIAPDGGTARARVSTASAPAVGGRRRAASVAGEQRGNSNSNSNNTPPTLRDDRNGGGAAGSVQEELRNDGSWRWQMARTLGGVGLGDLPWLRRIDLSASAGSLQLWLPGVEREGAAVTSPSAAGGSFDGGVEAVVASCGSCHGAVSIALSLLAVEEAEAEAELEEQVADPAAAATAAAASTPADSAEWTIADRCDELCVVSFGLHDLEVFVARPSSADFGAPSAGESPPPPAALGAEGGEDQALPASGPASSRSLQGGLSDGEGLVLPFSVDVKHVLTARSATPSSSPAQASVVAPSPSPSPPLLSEVDVSVTAIQVVLFLDLPLAARIAANSFAPLLGAGGAPASGTPSGPRVGEEAAASAAGTPAVVHGLSPPPSHGVDSRPEATVTAEDAVPATSAAVVPATAASSASSSLVKMWACRGGFKAAGLRAKVVNNFYRQKRPCVIVNVRTLSFFVFFSG